MHLEQNSSKRRAGYVKVVSALGGCRCRRERAQGPIAWPWRDSPKPPNTEPIKEDLVANQRESFDLRLGNEHSVERVSVFTGYQSGASGMLDGYRQLIEVLVNDDFEEPFRDLDRTGKLTDPNLGGDFPCGSGTNEYSRRRVANRQLRGIGKPLVAVQPPEKSMRVE